MKLFWFPDHCSNKQILSWSSALCGGPLSCPTAPLSWLLLSLLTGLITTLASSLLLRHQAHVLEVNAPWCRSSSVRAFWLSASSFKYPCCLLFFVFNTMAVYCLRYPMLYLHIHDFFSLLCLILSIPESQLCMVGIFTYLCLTLP